MSDVFFVFGFKNQVSVRGSPGLDAGQEVQIEAGRDLERLQGDRGGRVDDGDGEDLLHVHHQGGRLVSVF